jgi:pimeloyl-ACP methyl ester carboxylesterase
MIHRSRGIVVAATLSACHPFRSPEARERYLAHYDERVKSYPVPSQGRMVQTDRGETMVRISGPADAPPVILLPGKWSDSLMWPDTLIEGLSERYSLFAVDNIYDLGRSVSTGGKGGAADYVAWMGSLLDGLGLVEPVSFVGLSLGAWVAAEYALAAPARVAKMAWLSPGGIVAAPASIGTIPGIPIFFALTMRANEATVGRLMRWLMPRAETAGGSVKTEFDEYVREVTIGLESFAPLPAPLETDRRFSDAELRRLDMPLLYIAGQYDRFVPSRVALARLASVLPRTETHVFEGVGHEMIMAKPEEITSRLVAFLDAKEGTEWAPTPTISSPSK